MGSVRVSGNVGGDRDGEGEGDVPWRTWVKRVQTRYVSTIPMPTTRTGRGTPRITYTTTKKNKSTRNPHPEAPPTHLDPRQKGQHDDHRGVDPRPRTRPTDDPTAPITRQPPMLDSVLGEPWPINDGEFGMCVGQGAGLAHASSGWESGAKKVLIQRGQDRGYSL